MLSKKILQRNKIMAICLNSPEIKSGDTFRRVIVDDDSDCNLPKNSPVICCGEVNDEEMLFHTEDGRYYFSLIEGWGTEDGILYGLNTGLYFDFKHPTSVSDIERECNGSLGTYSSWCGAIMYGARKRTLETIIKTMKKHLFQD